MKNVSTNQLILGFVGVIVIAIVIVAIVLKPGAPKGDNASIPTTTTLAASTSTTVNRKVKVESATAKGIADQVAAAWAAHNVDSVAKYISDGEPALLKATADPSVKVQSCTRTGDTTFDCNIAGNAGPRAVLSLGYPKSLTAPYGVVYANVTG